MATDDRTSDKSAPSPDKQDDKIVDLPARPQTDKDAQVKGGRRKTPGPLDPT